MSLKRILGTMLVSRMAGRGRRGGGGMGGLGTAAMLGGLGGRRGGMGRKLGLAAMGYMAYKAYQDHQRSQQARPGVAGAAGGAGSATASGGLGGMIQGLADQFGLGGAAGGGSEPEPDLSAEEAAAARMSDDTALLHLRGMIAAAYADGALSHDERAKIMAGIDEAEPTASERATMEREIANPKPLSELLPHVRDHETAQQFYLASIAAIDPETQANRAYLADLRGRLGLSDDEVREAEAMTG